MRPTHFSEMLAQGIGQAVIALAIDLTGYAAASGADQTPEVTDKIYILTGCFAVNRLNNMLCKHAVPL